MDCLVCRPSGTASDFPRTQDLRPGLTYCAPPGLVPRRICSTGVTRREVLTRTLKR